MPVIAVTRKDRPRIGAAYASACRRCGSGQPVGRLGTRPAEEGQKRTSRDALPMYT
jgi:hypothetical protein